MGEKAISATAHVAKCVHLTVAHREKLRALQQRSGWSQSHIVRKLIEQAQLTQVPEMGFIDGDDNGDEAA